MSRNKMPSRQHGQKRETLAEIPFHELIEKNAELRKLREQHADLPVEQRRKAAEWAHDSAHASMLMAQAVNELDRVPPTWHDTVAPLAIDPEYAPAMLSVGSLEYQYGRVEEAMALFLSLRRTNYTKNLTIQSFAGGRHSGGSWSWKPLVSKWSKTKCLTILVATRKSGVYC